MREILTHKAIGPVNAKLQVQAVGPDGAGGAPMRYDITGYDASNNPSRICEMRKDETGETPFIDHADLCNPISRVPLLFQAGEPAEVGFNGLTMESLLAVVQDRLEHFQNGPYPCIENGQALSHVKQSLYALRARTERLTAESSGAKVATSATTT